MSSLNTLPDGFVYLSEINDNIIVDLRYFTDTNFIGSRIDGYKANRCIMTRDAANALNDAWKQFDNDGYTIVVYDSYRPQKAVDHFIRWSAESNDDSNKMKRLYYPHTEYSKCFELGYVAKRSGHTRGSTIDMTIISKEGKYKGLSSSFELIDRKLNDDRLITFIDDNTVDMGSSFDLFDPASWTQTDLVDATAQANRLYFVNTMKNAGFRNYEREWWHFTLINEPFPDTYFNFDVQ